MFDQLTEIHSKHLQCKKGCDLCCMDYSIFHFEYYTILDKLKAVNLYIEPDIKHSFHILMKMNLVKPT